MLNVKKGRADINPSNGAYTCNVCYVGKTQTFIAHGPGCTHTHVQHLWDNAPKEDRLPRMALTVDRYGIHLKTLEKTKEPDIKIALKDVSYFCAEGGAHKRIFSWISSNKIERKLECHVVLCSSKERAKMVAAHLSVALSFAYHEHRSEKERKQRLAKLQSESAASTVSTYSGTLAQNLHYRLAKERLEQLQFVSPTTTFNGDAGSAAASKHNTMTSFRLDQTCAKPDTARDFSLRTSVNDASQTNDVDGLRDASMTMTTREPNGHAPVTLENGRNSHKDVSINVQSKLGSSADTQGQSSSSYSEQARQSLATFLFRKQ